MSRFEKDLKNIVFCDTDLTVTESEEQALREELLNFPEDFWYWCTYRQCFLLLLYGNDSITNKRDLRWTRSACQYAPRLKKFVEDKVQPHFLVLPRIIVLRTKPGDHIPFHIDCNPEEVDVFNPKLRLCLSAPEAKLNFLKQGGGKLRALPRKKIYFMSGAYAHELINDTQEDRITLCWGAPWQFDTAYPSLYQSLQIEAPNAILRSDIGCVNQTGYAKDWEVHRLIQIGET